MSKFSNVLAINDQEKLEKYIFLNHFTEPEWVENRHSIASIFRSKDRCGIYILLFNNNEYYAGKAVDISRRFIQHSKVHSDIQKISYKLISKENLGSEELKTIQDLEELNIVIRNISLTSLPKGESDLDLIFPINLQENWLGGKYTNKHTERMINPVLRHKYSTKYKRLKEKPYFNELILPVMQEYFKVAIPEPKHTELDFWRCSCLPSENNERIIYSRINIYLQEVFTVGWNEEYACPFYSFHVAKSELSSVYRKSLSSNMDISFENHLYITGGVDQINVIVARAEDAIILLQNPQFIQSIKVFNLRLMKKGVGFNRNTHCMDLADELLG